MTWIEYDYVCNEKLGITLHKKVEYNEANIVIAKSEACNGEYTIVEDEEVVAKEPLAVELGGTGATTPSAARAKLGAAELLNGRVKPYQAAASVTTISESVTLGEDHFGKFLWVASSNDIVITIPKNETIAIPSSMEFEFCKGSTGNVTFSPASGVTLFSVDDARSITERYSCVVLKKINTDIWLLAGGLE